MKILQQTPQKLVIGTPASALLLVRLIGLAISFPGLFVLTIYVLSGAADYSSLNCQQTRPRDRQCRFLRLSPVRPFVYRFPIAAMQSTSLEARPRSSPSTAQDAAYRLQLQLTERRFPLSIGYSSQRQQQLAKQAQIQSFLTNPAASTLVIRDWPSLGGLILAGVFLIPTLPLSLLVIGIAATSVTVSFDKRQQQMTVTQKWLFGHEHQSCSFEEVDMIAVQRTLVGGRSNSKAPSARYALLIMLKSGKQVLRYDYFQQPPADHMAQAMRQFLAD